MKTAVIGSGGWGTALALVLLENGNEVSLICRREDKCRAMALSRENPQLKDVRLPDTLELTCDLNVVRDCSLVVMATPSFAVRETVCRLKPHLKPGAVLVLVSKGIERGTSLLLHQVVEQEAEGHSVVVLSGPSHAEEVARGIPTAVVVASEERRSAELVQDLFMNSNLRIYTSPDVAGVEISAAMKNAQSVLMRSILLIKLVILPRHSAKHAACRGLKEMPAFTFECGHLHRISSV
jgi:glycerol-3-phosphate dehydrogenase (NAD(P)+)